MKSPPHRLGKNELSSMGVVIRCVIVSFTKLD